jgi:hypothetical protein
MPMFVIECTLHVLARDPGQATVEAGAGLTQLSLAYKHIYTGFSVKGVAASTQAQTPAPTPARKSFHYPSTRKRDDLGGLMGSD